MKQEILQKMLAIAANLNHGDKARAIRDIPVSEPTLNKYLKGDIVKIDLAIKIIQYFESI